MFLIPFVSVNKNFLSILFVPVFLTSTLFSVSSFSQTNMHRVRPAGKSDEYVWTQMKTDPFSELILSWNVKRPQKGQFDFYVGIHHPRFSKTGWSPWRKIAAWGAKKQQTFVHTRGTYVHVKHNHVELKRGLKVRGYRIKIVAKGGANIKDSKALFANTINPNSFKKDFVPKHLSSVIIKNVPRQSQMKVNHKRRGDFCSPTSTSMIVRYFDEKFHKNRKRKSLDEQVRIFAAKSHDDSYLDIYGNWPLNVAQAFDDSFGKVYYRISRLNSFEELYGYLKRGIPVAVSIRGRLRGGYKDYNNGHFVVVVGWSQKRRAVLCIDPVFRSQKNMLRAYHEKDFLRAWGKSRNLSYVPMPLLPVR